MTNVFDTAHRLIDKSRSPQFVAGQQNRQAVKDFLSSHLGCTNREIATALGLSVYAVGRHVNDIRKEWLK